MLLSDVQNNNKWRKEEEDAMKMKNEKRLRDQIEEERKNTSMKDEQFLTTRRRQSRQEEEGGRSNKESEMMIPYDDAFLTDFSFKGCLKERKRQEPKEPEGSCRLFTRITDSSSSISLSLTSCRSTSNCYLNLFFCAINKSTKEGRHDTVSL